MNTSIKKISLLLAALLFCVLALAGCGGSGEGDDAVKGKWTLVTVKAYDTEFSAKDIEMENFVIEFDGKGSCTISTGIEGEPAATVAYELKDKTVTIKYNDEAFMTAELTDEKTMKAANYQNTGMDMTFTKQ